jgi:hypothetical protein
MSEQNAPQLDASYTVTLTLTLGEINLALSALGRAPFEQVESTINKIRIQANAAIHAAQHQSADNADTPATPEGK